VKQLLVAAWRYRNFIVSSIRADFRARFGRSKLGATWMVLQPLAQASIFAFVLSEILSAKLPGIDSRFAYPTYLLAGTLAWTLFADLLGRCINVFVDNANLLKKIAFPRIALPAIAVGVAITNATLLFVATSIVLLFIGHPPTLEFLWLIPVAALIVAFAVGLGLLLGVLNVFVRDVGQVMSVMLQLWFWLTPVVYMPTILSPSRAHIHALNPMSAAVGSFQQVVLYGQRPHLSTLLPLALASAILLPLGYVLFQRAAPEMVDEL